MQRSKSSRVKSRTGRSSSQATTQKSASSSSRVSTTTSLQHLSSRQLSSSSTHSHVGSPNEFSRRSVVSRPNRGKRGPSAVTVKRDIKRDYNDQPPTSKINMYTGPRRSAREMYKLYPVTPTLSVPDHIERPDYAHRSSGQPRIMGHEIEYKTDQEVQTMRKACEIASYIREFAGSLVRPGITTDEIDKRTHEEIIRLGVYPSPLGYCGFPKSLCSSVNNVICHGIPDLRPLEEGDIINLDVSIYVDGFHGDCSGTFVAGKTDDKAIHLIQQTRLALDNSIAICKPDTPLYAIGDEVQRIADQNGFGVVPGFCGHGIGKDFHMPPQIIHAFNRLPGVMKKGMVFTIEPIFNETPYSNYVMHDDKWTILTVDGSRSAQFEETIVITDTGADIMTKHKPGYFDKKM